MHEIRDRRESLPKVRDWPKRTSPVNCFAIHHSATGPNTTPERIAKAHTDPEPEGRGWVGIAYHYVITPDGVIHWTQPDEAFAWHGNDWNTGLGVCLVGDFRSGEPTDCQISAARWLLARKRREYGPIPLVGHYEAPRARTVCPGGTWPNWRDRIEGGRMRNTVLAIHTQSPPERGTPLTDMIRESRIDFINALDPDAWPETPDRIFPGKRIKARLFRHGDQWEHAFMRRGRAGADEYWAHIRSRIRKLRDEGGVLDFSGPNEPHPGLEGNDPVVLEDFWRRLIELFAAEGVRPWIWAFGVGWPAEGLAHHHVQSIRDAISLGGGLEVHEYSAPRMTDAVGWHVLRIKRTLEELYAAGLERGHHDWVLIGEMGIAWAVLEGNPDLGWKWWPGKDKGTPQPVLPPEFGLGYGVMDEERFWRNISWADDEYVAIPEVYRATPFLTLPYRDWETFDFGHSLIERAAHKWDQMQWSEAEIGAAISDAIQGRVLPLNPGAALYKAAKARDAQLVPASDEVPGPMLLSSLPENTIAQAFRMDDRYQEIGWTFIGQWDRIRWVRRAN